MDAELAAQLDALYRTGREHDATRPDRLDRLRNLEPDTAGLLAVLVRATGAWRLLEPGTSNGYSTLWLADAARATGGRLVSVDLDADRSAQAGATLTASPDGHWDLIFLDAERPHYAGYWPDLVRALRPGGLLAVDNVLSHADQVAQFRALVGADPRVTEAVAPTGAGALLVVNSP